VLHDLQQGKKNQRQKLLETDERNEQAGTGGDDNCSCETWGCTDPRREHEQEPTLVKRTRAAPTRPEAALTEPEELHKVERYEQKNCSHEN
jgi:hypothetical protein